MNLGKILGGWNPKRYSKYTVFSASAITVREEWCRLDSSTCNAHLSKWPNLTKAIAFSIFGSRGGMGKEEMQVPLYGVYLWESISSKLWLKLFHCTSSDFHPLESATPNREKGGNHAHIDSTATCPEKTCPLYLCTNGGIQWNNCI